MILRIIFYFSPITSTSIVFMRKIHLVFGFLICLVTSNNLMGQEYYFAEYQLFNKDIPTPEAFLGYPIGDFHTRHDLVVAYLEKLAEVSDRVTVFEYGRTHEQRKLVMAIITTPSNHSRLEEIKQKHLAVVSPKENINDFRELPLIVNLGYNVHGNEPSSTEAALLSAYTLAASEHPKINEILRETVVFLDPTINPDGRDRHTQWANSFRGNPLIADKYDIEHNEGWPYGRTNHYWFDLNRDLLLAVHPESQSKIKWMHDWYPNVVTDFHEQGTNSTYFFEPKNQSASVDPVTPKENYTTLNMAFAQQFAKDLDRIGTLYFTGEVYDSTYPGYGSTYGDLQGALALLFEQASARGHLQETEIGEISFAFAIRNQYISSISTLTAALENKELLYNYQNRFFKEAREKAAKSKVKAYVFGDEYDHNRTRAFIEMLHKHKVKVYELKKDLNIEKQNFKAGKSFVVPTLQDQYYMVQSIFETYDQYRDSVYYDTSAWSLVNAYNLDYQPITKALSMGDEVTRKSLERSFQPVSEGAYAYVIDYSDYYAPALLYHLLSNGINVAASSKPFGVETGGVRKEFGRGSLVVSRQTQKMASSELVKILNEASKKFSIQINPVSTGMTPVGNGLGSRSFLNLKKPKVMMFVEGDVSSYEAGEVWYLMEKRMELPLVKVPLRNFSRVDLDRYNTIVMVSGGYKDLSEKEVGILKEWVSKGNTLITSRTASSWAIKNKLVQETLVEKSKDSTAGEKRVDYGLAQGHLGRNSIGGAIFEVDLDITHPLAYGYHQRKLPVYKNNRVWLSPSKNEFSTVAKYTEDPHIDGFITPENLEYMSKSASILVSKTGKGRVVLFADNPAFRGTWFGTDKLLMNAILFGSEINVPD